jgi:hypothetical protein
MRHVGTNADLAEIHREGDGLIFNDYPSLREAAQYKVLHMAWCSGVGRMLGPSKGSGTPSVPKIFFATVDEADSWLALHRGLAGTGWKPCGTCLPGQEVTGGTASARKQPQAAPDATAPGILFTELQVEGLLYAYLRRAGFTVQEKVRVPSGIIDAVAERDGVRIVIEVKGEDKGGYTSAQMNFQMAIGQVSSRMTDPAAVYSVAFPMTPAYVRVLRTFRDSLMFGRLGLILYAVARDGSVQEVPSHGVGTWIENLSAVLQ